MVECDNLVRRQQATTRKAPRVTVIRTEASPLPPSSPSREELADRGGHLVIERLRELDMKIGRMAEAGEMLASSVGWPPRTRSVSNTP